MSIENSSIPSFTALDNDKALRSPTNAKGRGYATASWRNSESPLKSPMNSRRERLTLGTPRGDITERKIVLSCRTVSQQKTSRSYVRVKRLEIEYEMPDIEIPDFRIHYDLVSIVRKVNEFSMWNTESANWAIESLNELKAVLLPKGVQVMSLPKITDEVRLRLINLRNCVYCHF